MIHNIRDVQKYVGREIENKSKHAQLNVVLYLGNTHAQTYIYILIH